MRTSLALCLIFSCVFAFAQKEFPYSAKLADIDGNEINSTSFSNNGKPVIIDFWGSFCKPCIVKYNAMLEVYKKWQSDTGVRIIIVSIDHEKMQGQSKLLIEKYDWPYEAYYDSDQELMKQLTDENSVPRTFIFDGDHKLVYKSTGASILPKDENVDPKKVGEMLFGGASLESLTCDLSAYEEALYEIE